MINNTAMEFTLDIKLAMAEEEVATWVSEGGIGYWSSEDYHYVIGGISQGGGWYTLDMAYQEGAVAGLPGTIKIRPFSKGNIREHFFTNRCFKHAKAVYEKKEGGTVKLDLIKDVGKFTHCQHRYARIGYVTDKHGNPVEDKHGNYKYHVQRISKNEFENYWRKNQASIEKQLKWLKQQEKQRKIARCDMIL